MAEQQEIDDVLARLAAAPQRFARLMSKFEDADSVSMGHGDEWTPVDILAHMRAANDILEPRMLFILVRQNTPLLGYEEDGWLRVMGYRTLPVLELLDGMRVRRAEILHALRRLSPDDWSRTGNHEIRGPISVYDIALQITEHEDDHLAQIEACLGSGRGK